MEKNIFLKNKKEKFNPDVISSLTRKNMERKKIEFQVSKTVYNPITNHVPSVIKTQKDLTLKKDEPLMNIQIILQQKQDERTKQTHELKPQKLKTVQDNLVIDKHIENFEELKKSSEGHIKQTQQEHIKQKDNFDSIMSNLKSLGIVK